MVGTGAAVERVGSGERGRKAHRAGGRPVDFNLDDFALDHLCLFFDPHADRATERLRERLRLVHLQREDLTRRDRREGRVRPERLRHAHGDGGLAGTGLPRDHDGPAGDVPVLDHLEDHARSLARVHLPHHALRDHARLQRVIQTQAADVRVSADALDAGDILDLLAQAGAHVDGRHPCSGTEVPCESAATRCEDGRPSGCANSPKPRAGVGSA